MGCWWSRQALSEQMEASDTPSPLQTIDGSNNPVPANYRHQNRMSTTKALSSDGEAAVKNRLTSRKGGRYSKGLFGVTKDNNLVHDRNKAGERVYAAAG